MDWNESPYPLINDTNLRQSISITETTSTHDTLSKNEILVLVIILTFFSITGSIGNALAFYVFSTLKRQKLTSTIFILSLAGTDFITCLVTIPFTIAMEVVDYRIQVDFFCKLYHFLVTTTVQFSALIMVIIAVDRYLCICHPFLHWMTERRGKIIIASLACFIFLLGCVICAHYSIFIERNIYFDGFIANDTYSNFSSGNVDTSFNKRSNNSNSSLKQHDWNPGQKTVNLPSQCNTRVDTIDEDFFYILQGVSASIFLLCCVLVLILYSFIYRSVIAQRRKKLPMSGSHSYFPCHLSDVVKGDPVSEMTMAIDLTHINGENTTGRHDQCLVGESEMEETVLNPLQANYSSRNSLSRNRIERLRLANVKTAFMLFIVTLVFICSFLPSWLIALKYIHAPITLFYMYFIYNVVNPIIYAFLNRNFRTELKTLFNC